MKRIFLLTASLFFTHLVHSQSLEDFQWLDGKWKRQNVKPGTTAFETWNQSGSQYLGLGVTLSGTDTTFVEQLSILEKENEWYYVANVSHNDEPTYFKITALNEDGFVSENPNHDFPKKIEYKLEATTLTVIISAGEKAVGFVFSKVEN